jgi:hypothetical protein
MRPHVEIRRDGPRGFAVAISSRGGALDALLPPTPFADHGHAVFAAMELGMAAGWQVNDRTVPIGASA